MPPTAIVGGIFISLIRAILERLANPINQTALYFKCAYPFAFSNNDTDGYLNNLTM